MAPRTADAAARGDWSVVLELVPTSIGGATVRARHARPIGTLAVDGTGAILPGQRFVAGEPLTQQDMLA